MTSHHHDPRQLLLFDSHFAAAADTGSQHCSDNIAPMERRRIPRILLVDDDPATVLALSETLRQGLGEVIIDPGNYAPAAIRLLSSTTYNLIISDVVMPSADGLAVLQAAQWLQPQVPVILVTGIDMEREEAALYGGAYAFLEKPLDVDRFISVVRAALCRTDLERRVHARNQASFLNLIATLKNPSQ
jgi:DNA-binding NtrC family response regulator